MPFNGATNYFLVSRDPLDLTSATSQIFMGVRIECARCHNHPFEKWTQNDYYGLAAFFAGLRRVGNGNQTPAAILASLPDEAAPPPPRGRRLPKIRHPKTNQPVEPKFLDETEVNVEDDGDPRAALADWITSPANPFFARATANRVWAHFMGRGIVDPIDDFRATNPPSNPGAARRAGEGAGRSPVRPQAPDAGHHELAHLPALLAHQRLQQAGHAQLRPLLPEAAHRRAGSTTASARPPLFTPFGVGAPRAAAGTCRPS